MSTKERQGMLSVWLHRMALRLCEMGSDTRKRSVVQKGEEDLKTKNNEKKGKVKNKKSWNQVAVHFVHYSPRAVTPLGCDSRQDYQWQK